MSVKKIDYRGENTNGTALYVVRNEGAEVVFVTVTHGPRLHSASKIIAGICAKEGLDHRVTSFYELWTRMGYTRFTAGKYKYFKVLPQEPETELEDVILQPDRLNSSTGFLEVAIPEEIRELFKEQIG